MTLCAYDLDDRLTSVTDPIGRVASLARNNTTFDRLATTTYPDSSTEVLGYDADSNVLTRKTRKGDTITFTYDTLNRLSTKVAPSEASVTLTYDVAGRMIGARATPQRPLRPRRRRCPGRPRCFTRRPIRPRSRERPKKLRRFGAARITGLSHRSLRLGSTALS